MSHFSVNVCGLLHRERFDQSKSAAIGEQRAFVWHAGVDSIILLRHRGGVASQCHGILAIALVRFGGAAYIIGPVSRDWVFSGLPPCQGGVAW